MILMVPLQFGMFCDSMISALVALFYNSIKYLQQISASLNQLEKKSWHLDKLVSLLAEGIRQVHIPGTI